MDKTLHHARALRKHQTDAEKLLWSRLRNRQFNAIKFRRQHPIPPYIVDFFSEELNVVIELDGGQHTAEKDAERQKYITDKGFRVIRFWNNDVLENIDGVLENLAEFAYSSPSPKPSPQGEGLSKRICIGRIASAHGVKGLVKILPYGEDISLLEQAEGYKITLKNPIGKYMLAEIEGVTDRDASEALKGAELFVDRGVLPDIDDEGTFYVEDLVDRACIDEQSQEIGRIVAVENFGAGDLLNVRFNDGAETLIPFTDEYVPDVSEVVTLRNYKALII